MQWHDGSHKIMLRERNQRQKSILASKVIWIKNWWGTSLVAQWLRICLPMQGTQVRSLVQEGPTCCGAAKPVSRNYWACALELISHNYWAHAPNYWSHFAVHLKLTQHCKSTVFQQKFKIYICQRCCLSSVRKGIFKNKCCCCNFLF